MFNWVSDNGQPSHAFIQYNSTLLSNINIICTGQNKTQLAKDSPWNMPRIGRIKKVEKTMQTFNRRYVLENFRTILRVIRLKQDERVARVQINQFMFSTRRILYKPRLIGIWSAINDPVVCDMY